MEYNSTRPHLLYPEYGRNIQKMIEHALEIEDRQKRAQFVEAIIELIQYMNPQTRNLTEQNEKLWRHLCHIGNYALDIDLPEGMEVTPEDIHKKPARIPYPDENTEFVHYGRNVRKLVAKALEMEDEEKRKAFLEVIGSYMKLAYKNWNRDHFINDEVIRQDMLNLSENKLQIPEDANLDLLSVSSKKRKREGSHKNRNGRRRKK